MQEFEVSIIEKIDFGASGIDEILQNIRFILASSADSFPMDRDFAWKQETLDGPIDITKALIASQITDAIEQYENRVELISISVDTNHETGQLIPKVRVIIRDSTV